VKDAAGADRSSDNANDLIMNVVSPATPEETMEWREPP
jgi:hypothetical protein